MSFSQLETCKECIKKANKKWTGSMDSDVTEGICPKIPKREVYVCEITGKKLIQK
jgi:hypothetical protein